MLHVKRSCQIALGEWMLRSRLAPPLMLVLYSLDDLRECVRFHIARYAAVGNLMISVVLCWDAMVKLLVLGSCSEDSICRDPILKRVGAASMNES